MKDAVTPAEAGRSHLGTGVSEPIENDTTSTLFQPAPAWGSLDLLYRDVVNIKRVEIGVVYSIKESQIYYFTLRAAIYGNSSAMELKGSWIYRPC